jgi:ketosteroid isomerase-like protein
MKKTHFLAALCVIVLTVFSSCTTTPVDIKADVDAITGLESQWTVALQENNVDKIMSFFDVNAVNMVSNNPIVTGLQAIKNRIVTNFADTSLLYKTYTCTLDTVEVSASGDLAYARGHDHISRNKESGVVVEKGKFIDIWKKINGEWKVIVFIGNSDNPAEE